MKQKRRINCWEYWTGNERKSPRIISKNKDYFLEQQGTDCWTNEQKARRRTMERKHCHKSTLIFWIDKNQQKIQIKTSCHVLNSSIILTRKTEWIDEEQKDSYRIVNRVFLSSTLSLSFNLISDSFSAIVCPCIPLSIFSPSLCFSPSRSTQQATKQHSEKEH